MLIQIDPSNGLAIYDQVVRQVKFAVASDVLRSGELVPSVRELARELAINPNTVARAYRCLQDGGVLEAVRGQGLAVTAQARDRCVADRLQLIRSRLQQVLVEGKQSRLGPQELRAIVEEELQALEGREE